MIFDCKTCVWSEKCLMWEGKWQRTANNSEKGKTGFCIEDKVPSWVMCYRSAYLSEDRWRSQKLEEQEVRKWSAFCMRKNDWSVLIVRKIQRERKVRHQGIIAFQSVKARIWTGTTREQSMDMYLWMHQQTQFQKPEREVHSTIHQNSSAETRQHIQWTRNIQAILMMTGNTL